MEPICPCTQEGKKREQWWGQCRHQALIPGDTESWAGLAVSWKPRASPGGPKSSPACLTWTIESLGIQKTIMDYTGRDAPDPPADTNLHVLLGYPENPG